VIGWRGGQLDRLLDERHADIVKVTARRVRADAWLTLAEVTFANLPNMGRSTCWPSARTSELSRSWKIKSEIGSIEETHRRHDVKVRLPRAIMRDRFGWEPRTVGRILVVPEDRTIRRVVERHSATFAASYPARNREGAQVASRASGTDRRPLVRDSQASPGWQSQGGRYGARPGSTHEAGRMTCHPRSPSRKHRGHA